MELSTAVALEDVKAVVVETLGIEDRADTLDADTPLFGALPELDSMAVLEVRGRARGPLRHRRSTDEDVTGEVFETLGTLTEFVDGQLRALKSDDHRARHRRRPDRPTRPDRGRAPRRCSRSDRCSTARTGTPRSRPASWCWCPPTTRSG